ncbi:MAG: aromatic ring hydroxylase [Chloroflexi bacterium]|nr:MAG: aromatic ring hydroxylase [Chloroflexota bacterium]RLC91494.1 MAG: aromatic ring hydroxylase [Chloroflexota bacterium]HEY68049.1 metal-sulfur cluster assembly factor [Thermoflexia bacterium]
MARVTEQAVREALRQVIDPHVGMDLVTMGMIRQVEIDEEGKVEVKMVLTAPFCPLASYLVEQVHRTTAQVPGVQEANVTLLDEQWDPAWMERPAGQV